MSLLLEKHRDTSFDDLRKRGIGGRVYAERLTFDPTSVEYYNDIKQKLELTEDEIALYKSNGFVSVDQVREHTFASAYYQIWAQELPLLVTSDSILNALHRSYDLMLEELEQELFAPTIGQILEDCHTAVGQESVSSGPLMENYRDVDLYLTVARNLLAGAAESSPGKDEWNLKLIHHSRFGQDAEALQCLRNIQSLTVQYPARTSPTEIYGGSRYVDYSQFEPRGHYADSTELRRYFRCLMWLGRADCGWNLLPPDPTTGLMWTAIENLSTLPC